MLTVETIGRIRRAYFIDGKPIRRIVREELRVSRKTVREAVRATATEFRYERRVQPQPRGSARSSHGSGSSSRPTPSARRASG